MNESPDNKFEKYWDTTLMLCYFWIPFFGMYRALKTYTDADHLPIMSIVLILFISGNIVTWMILWLDEKSLFAKSMWTVALIVMMVVLNVLAR